MSQAKGFSCHLSDQLLRQKSDFGVEVNGPLASSCPMDLSILIISSDAFQLLLNQN